MDAVERYDVIANNLSRESENKIHDDAVARKFGFTGALVPGVEVYAYACHLIVARWGRDWLERGSAECKLLKPVYDGRTAIVTAQAVGSGLEWRVESDGVLCATGTAALEAEPPARPDLTDYPRRPLPLERPAAGPDTLAAGTWFTSKPMEITAQRLSEYLDGTSESLSLFTEGRLVHPGLILRLCNFVLAQNVVLGPWIHVGSRIQNFSAAHEGETLSARAQVLYNYERKGHRFVDLDVAILADDERIVSSVFHTAIYQPRQVTEAA